MLNPFAKFVKEMIPGFTRMKRVYFVSQTNKSAIEPLSFDQREHILLTDYEDIGLAKIHYNAVSNDKYKAILDLTKPEHRAKLLEMLKPDSKYIVYSAFIENEARVTKLLNDKYSNNIRGYVATETSWRIGKDQVLKPNLELIFGELFVTLKWSGQKVKLRLVDIEKY